MKLEGRVQNLTTIEYQTLHNIKFKVCPGCVVESCCTQMCTDALNEAIMAMKTDF